MINFLVRYIAWALVVPSSKPAIKSNTVLANDSKAWLLNALTGAAWIKITASSLSLCPYCCQELELANLILICEANHVITRQCVVVFIVMVRCRIVLYLNQLALPWLLDFWSLADSTPVYLTAQKPVQHYHVLFRTLVLSSCFAGVNI